DEADEGARAQRGARPALPGHDRDVEPRHAQDPRDPPAQRFVGGEGEETGGCGEEETQQENHSLSPGFPPKSSGRMSRVHSSISDASMTSPERGASGSTKLP